MDGFSGLLLVGSAGASAVVIFAEVFDVGPGD